MDKPRNNRNQLGGVASLTTVVLLAIAILAVPQFAIAGQTVQSAADVRVDTLRLVSVSSTNLTFTTSGDPFAAETSTIDLVATVRANNNYRILVRAYKDSSKDTSTSWSATNGRTSKPLSDLKCNNTGLSPSTDFVAVSNGTPTPSTGTQHTLTFKVALDFQNDGPISVTSNAVYNAVAVITVSN